MEETFAKYINVNGELMDLSRPQVMGILNVTPDSFYADSRKQAEEDIVNRVHQIIEEGGRIMTLVPILHVRMPKMYLRKKK